MYIGDHRFPQRLAFILQAKGTSPKAPQEMPFIGAVVTIPGAAVLERLASFGRVRAVVLANPAAGAEWTYTVPLGESWNFQLITARFVADANVATRIPRLSIRVPDLGGTLRTVGFVPAIATVLATTTADLTWGRGINSRQSAGGLLEFGNDLPYLAALPPGSTVQSVTGNIQVGDQYSALAALIEPFDT